MVSQQSQIFSFLSDNKPSAFTSRQVFEELDIRLFSSVRGRLSELHKAKKIKSRKSKFLRRLEYFVSKDFRRKIVKSIFYCRGDPHREGHGKTFYALTYEDNKEDRKEELANAISISPVERDGGLMEVQFLYGEDKGNLSFINVKDCVQASEFGYDDDFITEFPPFTWPNIEVGVDR